MKRNSRPRRTTIIHKRERPGESLTGNNSSRGSVDTRTNPLSSAGGEGAILGDPGRAGPGDRGSAVLKATAAATRLRLTTSGAGSRLILPPRSSLSTCPRTSTSHVVDVTVDPAPPTTSSRGSRTSKSRGKGGSGIAAAIPLTRRAQKVGKENQSGAANVKEQLTVEEKEGTPPGIVKELAGAAAEGGPLPPLNNAGLEEASHDKALTLVLRRPSTGEECHRRFKVLPKNYMELQQMFAQHFPKPYSSLLLVVERPNGITLDPTTRKFARDDVIIFRELGTHARHRPAVKPRGFELEYKDNLRKRVPYYQLR